MCDTNRLGDTCDTAVVVRAGGANGEGVGRCGTPCVYEANVSRPRWLTWPPSTISVRRRKNQMSTRTFEGVLHPVFQEEEATLIIAGAILGAIAGFLQMLLSTKGVRDAAKKAAALAAEKASAAVRKERHVAGLVCVCERWVVLVDVCDPRLYLDNLKASNSHVVCEF